MFKRILVGGLALIGALVIVLALATAGVVLYYWKTGKETVPEKTVLQLDFQRGVVETAPESPVAAVMREKVPVLRNVVDAIDRAASDPRVRVLVARVGVSNMGLAQVQELRNAVLRFRDSGKETVAFAETFGEFGPGHRAYYLASAFDTIYLLPSGDLGLTGLISETAFFKGSLEKLGIEPQLAHRKEYKSMKNLFTERGYTRAHREATEAILESVLGQMVKGIAEAREMPEEQMRALFTGGPYSAAEALELKLIDALAYRDEVMEDIKEELGADVRLLTASQYRSRLEAPEEPVETIALIYGIGNIMRGRSERDPFSDSITMGSDTIVKAFQDAAKDDAVKAILFRVDSPGGSYVASDIIWSQIMRVRESGKPVIVSMGNVAGSGGYFVSMAGDRIIAEPGTLTGSIGVVAGKMVLSGFWDKLGVSWDSLQIGENADMWSFNQDYTQEQWKMFQDWLDRVYDDFVTKAARSRGMPKEELEEVAGGRVWTGEDAEERGLVDELGGFELALTRAREAAKISESAEVRLKIFPRRKSPMERLVERLLQAESARTQESAFLAVRRTMETVRPLVRAARQTGLLPPPGVLTMENPLANGF